MKGNPYLWCTLFLAFLYETPRVNIPKLPVLLNASQMLMHTQEQAPKKQQMFPVEELLSFLPIDVYCHSWCTHSNVWVLD